MSAADITLIDDNPERLEGIGSNFEMLTICDSPSSIETLKRADVGKADLFIGVTPDEAHNMTCCMLASKLGAAKTVARVDNYEYTRPEHRDFFKTVGIDSIIYPEMLAGREIMHNACHSWVRQWLEIKTAPLLMLGIKVREDAHILDVPLRRLCGPEAPYHIVAIKRGAETIIPHGDDCVEAGDMALFYDHEGICRLSARHHWQDGLSRGEKPLHHGRRLHRCAGHLVYAGEHTCQGGGGRRSPL